METETEAGTATQREESGGPRGERRGAAVGSDGCELKGPRERRPGGGAGRSRRPVSHAPAPGSLWRGRVPLPDALAVWHGVSGFGCLLQPGTRTL